MGCSNEILLSEYYLMDLLHVPNMLSVPRKEIFNPDDMSKWLKSEAYQVSNNISYFVGGQKK